MTPQIWNLEFWCVNQSDLSAAGRLPRPGLRIHLAFINYVRSPCPQHQSRELKPQGRRSCRHIHKAVPVRDGWQTRSMSMSRTDQEREHCHVHWTPRPSRRCTQSERKGETNGEGVGQAGAALQLSAQDRSQLSRFHPHPVDRVLNIIQNILTHV